MALAGLGADVICVDRDSLRLKRLMTLEPKLMTFRPENPSGHLHPVCADINHWPLDGFDFRQLFAFMWPHMDC